MRNLAAEETFLRKGNDAQVGLRIREIGGGSSTPTVTFTDTASDITLVDSNGTSITADLSAAAYDTMGELADWINGNASWECRVLDALRTDASNDVFFDGSVSSSTSEEGETVFDCLIDSSALASYRLRVSLDRKAGGDGNDGVNKNHRVVLKKFQYYADITAAAGGVKLYKTFGTRQSTEVQVASWASVDTTDGVSGDTRHNPRSR